MIAGSMHSKVGKRPYDWRGLEEMSETEAWTRNERSEACVKGYLMEESYRECWRVEARGRTPKVGSVREINGL